MGDPSRPRGLHLVRGQVVVEFPRYDGEKFVNFMTDDGLAQNYVSSIYQDREGFLWFGTNGGVSRYDGDRFVTSRLLMGFQSNSIRSIYEDKSRTPLGLEPEAAMEPPDMTVKDLSTSRPMLDSHKMMCPRFTKTGRVFCGLGCSAVVSLDMMAPHG